MIRIFFLLLVFIQPFDLFSQDIDFNIRQVNGYSESFMKGMGIKINAETAQQYIFDKMDEVNNSKDSSYILYQTELISLCEAYLKRYPEVLQSDSTSDFGLSLRRESIEICKAACFFKRAQLKANQGDFSGGAEDLSETILIHRKDRTSFGIRNLRISLGLRGWDYSKLNLWTEACTDWREAVNLGDSESIEFVKKICQSK
jgi:hypothetical protein